MLQRGFFFVVACLFFFSPNNLWHEITNAHAFPAAKDTRVPSVLWEPLACKRPAARNVTSALEQGIGLE